MNQEREPHNSFEKSATFYLEAANAALLQGQHRLAIHLFRAAFEIESTYGSIVSTPIIEGLRKAWDLACELSDRSIAESIFGDLSTFNSLEQNEQAGVRLQALALSQLEDMGIGEADLENIAGAISQELVAPEHENLFDSLKSMLKQMGLVDDGEGQTTQAIQKLPHALPQPVDDQDQEDIMEQAEIRDAVELSKQSAAIHNSLAGLGKHLKELQEKKSGSTQESPLNFQTLSGYSKVMGHMREFGFLPQDDEQQRDFVERAAAMHGVSQLSLDGAFLFYGPTREDVSLFAHVVAGEIGYPLLHIAVDLDAQGNGTIKLAGPFRRNFFGSPPDIMDMATPAIVLIENIDYLQKLFNNEQIAIQRNGGKPRGMAPGMGRSMQAEISSYIHALRQKPGVVMMATAQDLIVLQDPLLDLLEPINEIEVSLPSDEERQDIISAFIGEHPSFAELDVDQIVHYSQGMSRNDLVTASHMAVEQAYRESLRTGIYSDVTLDDVLVQLASHVDHGSVLYQQIEDEVVAKFTQDLEEDML